MSITNFIPQIWAGVILRELENLTIARQICDLQYEGEIKGKGDTVKLLGLADPTINDYTGSVTYEELEDASQELKILKQKYFAFKVDDVDKTQAHVNLMDSQNKKAAYKLRDTADALVMGLYSQCLSANTITDATLDTATILSVIARMGQILDENNVPAEGRWAVIPPWWKAKLVLIGFKFGVEKSGIDFLKELGFTFYVSNNLTDLGTNQHQVMAGGKNAIAYIDQIVNVEALRLQSSFSDAIRGLHVYGYKIVKPKEIVRVNGTYAADTAI